ncbi:DUF6455 family protein [Mesobacterium sp. TK19101]|uniref:DUF6455 family protein n=1 Tax=Mesobacterium hydrothermale TaxID=3111907 RepID=A0ABU6HFR8_9RHOB|nr:DUF6455 family protein [Mesobacterium sp. TK19101]MEC3861262.1 DUF6455 family protein [Mesobacterium sp. TK19101]
MQSTKTLRRHAQLVDRMADALGIDLEEEALRGHLTISEIDDAVLRCTGCTNPDSCEHWLDTGPQASDPPGYCRNAELFGDLRNSHP